MIVAQIDTLGRVRHRYSATLAVLLYYIFRNPLAARSRYLRGPAFIQSKTSNGSVGS